MSSTRILLTQKVKNLLCKIQVLLAQATSISRLFFTRSVNTMVSTGRLSMRSYPNRIGVAPAFRWLSSSF